MTQRQAKARLLLRGGRIAGARRLSEGGEAFVYGLAQPAAHVLKEYRDKVIGERGGELERKLRAMLAKPPADPTARQKHVSIAWPDDISLDEARAFTGYVMLAIDIDRTVELHQVQTPSDRTRASRAARDTIPAWLSGFTWRYLLRVAANLSSAVAAIHAEGYVIGDFNGRNVRVSHETLVTLLDCDSFQVPGPRGEVFLCQVQLPGTLPPELTGADLTKVKREPSGDLYLLAQHIYALLFEGHFSYQGTWVGRGEGPSPAERKQKGVFHYSDRRLRPPVGTPPFDMLPRELQRLCMRAFTQGATDLSVRPSAEEWRAELTAVEGDLNVCSRSSEHVYPAHLGLSCPWCALQASTRGAVRKVTSATHEQTRLPPAKAVPATKSPTRAAAPRRRQAPRVATHKVNRPRGARGVAIRALDAVILPIGDAMRRNGGAAVGIFFSALLLSAALMGVALWLTFLPNGFGDLSWTALKTAAGYVLPVSAGAALLAWTVRVLASINRREPETGEVYDRWAVAAPAVAILSAAALEHTTYVPPTVWPAVAITPAIGYIAHLSAGGIAARTGHDVARVSKFGLIAVTVAAAWLLPRGISGAVATPYEQRLAVSALKALPGVKRCKEVDIAWESSALLRDSLSADVHCSGFSGSIPEILLAFRNTELLNLYFSEREQEQPGAITGDPGDCLGTHQGIAGIWELDGKPVGQFMCYGQASIEWSDSHTNIYARYGDGSRRGVMAWWQRNKASIANAKARSGDLK